MKIKHYLAGDISCNIFVLVVKFEILEEFVIILTNVKGVECIVYIWADKMVVSTVTNIIVRI